MPNHRRKPTGTNMPRVYIPADVAVDLCRLLWTCCDPQRIAIEIGHIATLKQFEQKATRLLREHKLAKHVAQEQELLDSTHHHTKEA